MYIGNLVGYGSLIFIIFFDIFLVYGTYNLRKEGYIRAMWLFVMFGILFTAIVLFSFWFSNLFMDPTSVQLTVPNGMPGY